MKYHFALGLLFVSLVSFAENGDSQELSDRIRQTLADLAEDQRKERQASNDSIYRRIEALEKHVEKLGNSQWISEKSVSEFEAEIARLRAGFIADPLRPEGIKVGCRLPESNYFISREGGCKNKESGLVFGWPSTEPLTWKGAYDYCDRLLEAGYRDWELPSEPDLKKAAYHGGADLHFNFPVDKGFWLAEPYIANKHGKEKDTIVTFALVQWMNLKTGARQGITHLELAPRSKFDPPSLTLLSANAPGVTEHPIDHMKKDVICVRKGKPQP